MVELPYVRRDDFACAPGYAKAGDAGADLVATETVVLPPNGGRALVSTGLSIAIPEGHAGLVLARSGLAIEHGVTCLNAPGLIDSGFRGEIQVVLVNTDPDEPYEIKRGDRIAQLIVVRVEQAQFFEVSDLPNSERGFGGFGHSGR